MNNENSLESEFLVYAAKAELKQHQKMTDSKTNLDSAKLDSAKLENELATVYREMAALRRELLAKDDEIDDLNKKLSKKDLDWRKVL